MNKRKLLNQEINMAISKIDDWYNRKSKALTISTIPYNSILIFKNIILDVIQSGKKVLYLWNGNEENKDLLKKLKLEKKDLAYGYKSQDLNGIDINFVNYNDCEDISEIYELAIIDDISIFSTLNKEDIRRKYDSICNNANRVILYSIETIIPTGEYFELPSMFSTGHFVEPRLMTTRIDLTKDIPYILYDYLKWFIENEQKVVMYVPDEECLGVVCEYYANKLKLHGVKVTALPKFDREKTLKDVLKLSNKSMLIITDRMEETFKDLAIGGAIVLFANNRNYNYRQFIYICGEIFKMNLKFPEVLLVGNEVSYDMDEAKEIARNFNIKIWESNYLEL